MLQQQTASDSSLKDMIRSKLQLALCSISRITEYILFVLLGVFLNSLAIE